jgi:hypothetical protein
VLEYPVFVDPKSGAMIWRHQHQHAGTGRGGLAAPIDGDLSAEMAAGDDDRTATGDMGKAKVGQRVPLMVGEQKLLGVVCEHADPINALIEHAVEDAALPFEVEVTGGLERRRCDRKHAGVSPCGLNHGKGSRQFRSLIGARPCRGALADRKVKVCAVVRILNGQ